MISPSVIALAQQIDRHVVSHFRVEPAFGPMGQTVAGAAGEKFPGCFNKAAQMELLGNHLGRGVEVVKVDFDLTSRANRLGMQIVFQAAFACQDCLTMRAAIDRFRSLAPMIGLRR